MPAKVRIRDVASSIIDAATGFDRLEPVDVPRLIYEPSPTTEEPDFGLAYRYDFRGWDRTIHYPTSEYGWFRDDKPKVNIPMRGRALGKRPWSQIQAILLHCAAVNMRGPRFLGTPCHSFVDDNAAIGLCHPPTAYVPHAHLGRYGRFAIGIECSGKPNSQTPEQIDSLKSLIVYYIALHAKYGTGQLAIMAHRQTHWSRANDPGELIWREVGFWAIEEKGLIRHDPVGTGKTTEKWER